MKPLQFEDGGRTFTCEPGASPATPGIMWWWIKVSGESQRYAGFRTEPGDTAATVRPRVIAYYAKMLEDRARPRVMPQTWAQRREASKAQQDANAANAPQS